eukprot:TRINITY_DN59742_c0_g1_i1.p1 TRINITY_DN59742_c0_g1~~TRINITY_DN59742_c0_g1_i1.p1  ORF type:complete len:166 (-),score=0.25 TRINITY_DN59742_c0_g1_i1:42-539(-)
MIARQATAWMALSVSLSKDKVCGGRWCYDSTEHKCINGGHLCSLSDNAHHSCPGCYRKHSKSLGRSCHKDDQCRHGKCSGSVFPLQTRHLRVHRGSGIVSRVMSTVGKACWGLARTTNVDQRRTMARLVQSGSTAKIRQVLSVVLQGLQAEWALFLWQILCEWQV